MVDRRPIRRDCTGDDPPADERLELHSEFGCVVARERAILDAPPMHIDLGAFRTYLERLGFDTTADPQPDSEDDLRNRDVIVEIGGEMRATLYGILAFGKDPQRYRRTRNFRVECVAYAGDDRVRVVDETVGLRRGCAAPRS